MMMYLERDREKKMNKIEEMKKLVEILNAASNAYYNGKETLMSDQEFDLKLKHLEELEKELGTVLSDSPTVNVGAPVLDSLEKIKHDFKPMLSLAKVHSAEEITKFANGEELLAMVKLDGLSCRLTYQDCKLIKAETRGDGETGNLIYEHSKQFKNIPLTINKEGTYVIDGEAIITDEDFIAINNALPKGTEKFKNSRNLASGTLALLDMNIVKERKITFVVWDVIVGSEENTIVKKLDEAERLGFDIVPYIYNMNQHTITLNEQDINEMNKRVLDMAKENGYLCDGVVWKFNNVDYGESLGRTEHHFNLGRAWKPAITSYPTKLIDVEWTMGKTGSLCPTIITEPVEIDGSSVSKASVHNVSIFKDFGFTKGCTCYLYKANLIIPQCEYVEDNNGEPFEIPSVCPVCGSPTEIIKQNDTEVLYCANKNCNGLMLGKLNAFVSKQAMDIDGLSEQTLDLLMSKGYISTFKDLYHLSDYKAELSTLPKMGSRSVKKLLDAIEVSRKTTLDRFLTALSIPLCGKATCKDIAKYCHSSIDEFIFIINNTSLEFMTIDKFGSTMLDSLLNWWEENMEMVYELLEELDLSVPEEKKESNTGVNLNNATFCITGKLEHFANRDAMIESIVQHGGQYLSGVSAKLNYLVNNDKTSTSGKNKKALDMQIPIISETDYLRMIGELN
jgi:DNA ligase (NAD+)